MDRYLVIGHPVAHSLSPQIHSFFAAATGEALDYGRLEAPLDGFAASAAAQFDQGLAGANVTVPFKAQACVFADELDAAAARAGVVNTLRREPDGRIRGFNTDGAGLVRDLEQHLDFNPAGMRVVMIGAGGAAAGVIEPLLAAGVAELLVVNRNAERGRALVARFTGLGEVRPASIGDLPRADLVLNATAASLAGAVPDFDASCIGPETLAYDMMYGAAAAPFLDHCRAAGARRGADGLGMLVEQAAAAFELWRGVRPATGQLLATLRASLPQSAH